MAILRVFNKSTGKWDKISATSAEEIELRNKQFVSGNVEGALEELRKTQDILTRNIAYIYKHGTIGGGGGSGSGSGGGQVLGEHIILPVNFLDTGEFTYFSNSKDVILRFTIKSGSSARFNITVKAGTTVKTAVGKNGQLIEVNLGKLSVGKYQVFITGSTASGLSLDPSSTNIIVSRFDIDTSAYDPNRLHSPYAPAEINLRCNSDYVDSDLILYYQISGSKPKSVQVIPNTNTVLKVEHGGVIGNHPVSLWMKTTETNGEVIETEPITLDVFVGSATDLYIVYSSDNTGTANTKMNLNVKFSIVLDSPKLWDIYYTIYDEDGKYLQGVKYEEDGSLPKDAVPIVPTVRSGTYSTSIPTSSLPEGTYKLRLHGKDTAGTQESVNDTMYEFRMVNNEKMVIYDPVQSDLIAWFNGGAINQSSSVWVNQVQNSPITCDLIHCDGVNTGVINEKDALILNGGAYARINYAPFKKENASVDKGLTIHVTYKANSTSTNRSRVLDCAQYSLSDEIIEGISLTEEDTILKTTAAVVDTNLASDTWIHVTYVIKYTGIRIYVNGVLTSYHQTKTQDKTSYEGLIYLGSRVLSSEFTYTHIKYSVSMSPDAQMGNLPDKYIGILVNNSPISSENRSEYQWSKVTAEAPNETSTYIRYSDESNGSNMNDSFGSYVGYCTTVSKTAPTSPLEYVWHRLGGSEVTDLGDVEIHDIKIYDTDLSSPKIVFNYVTEDYTCPANIQYKDGLKLYDDERQLELRSLNSIYDNTTSLSDEFQPDLSTSSNYPIVKVTFNDASIRQNFWSFANSTNLANDPHKFDKFPCNISYSDPKMGITLNISGSISLQGTTSLNYKAKNFDLFYGTDANNRPILFTPRPYDRVEDPREAWLPENNHTLKCNLMDSSHANNLGSASIANDLFDGLARSINDSPEPKVPEGYSTQLLNETGALYEPKSSASMNPNYKSVKNAIVGFPVLVVIEDTKTESGSVIKFDKYIGVYTFQTGRYSYYNLGLKAYQYEVDPNGLVTDYADIEDRGIYDKKRKSIYAFEADSSNNYGSVAFKQFDDGSEGGWVASEWTRRYPEDADTDLTDSRKNISEIIRITSRSAQVNTNKLEVGMDESRPVLDEDGNPVVLVDANDPSIVRWNDADNFVWWNKSTLLDYFLCVMMLGMADSLGKNFVIKTWKKSADGKVGYWNATFYDMDTVLGKDNVGIYNHNPDMDIDTYFENQKEGGGNGFTKLTYGNPTHIPPGDLRHRTGVGKNGNTTDTFNLRLSRLWGLLRDNNWASRDGVPTYGPELAQDLSLQSRWRHLRKSGIFTLDNIMKKYTAIIHSIGANYYNLDAEIKYMNDPVAREFMHGTSEFYTRSWLEKRIQYLDSLFQVSDLDINGNYGEFTVDMRLNEFTTDNNKTALFDVRTKFPIFLSQTGESANLDTFSILTRNEYNTTFAYGVTANDKPYKLNYAPMITSIDGIEKYNPSQLIIYNALNLSKLSLRNCKKLKKVDTSQCYALVDLDLSGCTELTSIDLSNCERLQRLNISRTGIMALDIKSGGLRELNISNSSLKELVLQHQKFLDKVDFSSCPSLRSLKIVDTAMKEVYVSKSGITDITIESCKVLEKIIIEDCKSLVSVTVNNCENVEVVRIEGCNNSSFAPLTRSKQIEASSDIVAENIRKSVYLGGCPNIEELSFKDSTAEVVTLSGKCDTVEVLNLESSGLLQFIFTADGENYKIDTMRGCLFGTSKDEEDVIPAIDLSNFPEVIPLTTDKTQAASFINVNWTSDYSPLNNNQLIRVTGEVTILAEELPVLVSNSSLSLNPWYRIREFDEEITETEGEEPVITLVPRTIFVTDEDIKALGDDILRFKFPNLKSVMEIARDSDSITMEDIRFFLKSAPNLEKILKGVTEAISVSGSIEKLLDNNKKLREVHYLFNDTPLGTKLPEDFFDELTLLEDISYMFYGHNGITLSGPSFNILKNNTLIRNIKSLFDHQSFGTGGTLNRFKGLDIDIEKFMANLPNLETAEMAFANTGANILFKDQGSGFYNNPKLESLKGMFIKCKVEGNIPQNIFGSLSDGKLGESSEVTYPFETLKDTSRMFEGCVFSEKVRLPNQMMSGLVNLVSVDAMFANSNISNEVPEGMLKGCSSLLLASSLFMGTNISGDIPNDIFEGCDKLSSVVKMFMGCKGIEGVSSDLLVGLEGVTDISNLFSSTSIVKVGHGVIRNLPNLTNAIGFLSGCEKLESIEGNPITECPNLTNITSMVSSCPNLLVVSPLFLSEETKIKDAKNLFMGASSLGSIPETLFAYSPELEDVTKAFSRTSISTIPVGLFNNNKKLISIEGLFEENYSITEIPEDLLSELVDLKNVNSAFRLCGGIREIPENLFVGLDSLTTATSMFESSGVEEIPAKLFYNSGDGFPNLMNLDSFVRKCYGIKTLPLGLFDNVNNLTTARSFLRETSVEKLPNSIFPNHPKLMDVSYFLSECPLIKPQMTEGGVVTSYLITKDFFGEETRKSIISIDHMFDGSDSFTEKCIENGAFHNLPNLTSAICAFRSTMLTTLPVDTFSGCTRLYNIRGMFAYCDKLSYLDEEMFRKYHEQDNPIGNNINNVYALFYECEALSKSPKFYDEEFYQFSSLDNYAGAFYNCISYPGYDAEDGPGSYWISELNNFETRPSTDIYGDDYVSVKDMV